MIAACLRGTAASMMLLWLSSCPKPGPSAKPQRIETVWIKRGCLTDEMKPVPERSFTATAEADGRQCYPAPDAVAAAIYMQALERWIDNAIVDCASSPTAPADAGVDATH